MRRIIIFSIILLLVVISVSALIMPSRTITQPIIIINTTEPVDDSLEEPVGEDLESYPQIDVREETVFTQKAITDIDYYPQTSEAVEDVPEYQDEYQVVRPINRTETEYETGPERYYQPEEAEEKTYEPLKRMEPVQEGETDAFRGVHSSKYDIEMSEDANKAHFITYDNLGKISEETTINFETGEITDIDALIEFVMSESWRLEEEELNDLLENLHRMNELKKNQRDYINEMKKEQKDAVYTAMKELMEQAYEEQKDKMLEMQAEKETAFEAQMAAVEEKKEEIDEKTEAAKDNFFTGVVNSIGRLFGIIAPEEPPSEEAESEVKQREYEMDMEANFTNLTNEEEKEKPSSLWTKIKSIFLSDN